MIWRWIHSTWARSCSTIELHLQVLIGAPWEDRTPDLLGVDQMLIPAELRAHKMVYKGAEPQLLALLSPVLGRPPSAGI